MEQEKAIDHIIHKLRNELPSKLKYHSLYHTLEVMESAKKIGKAEGINKREEELLLTAAAYHDSGFLRTYKNHEEASCRIAAENLPRFGYSPAEISDIQNMIMATKVPQNPKDHLSRILCDADLDYLGGSQYDEISVHLYNEMVLEGIDIDPARWLDIQINFLEVHHYWTDYGKRELAPQKARVLKQLKMKQQEAPNS